jgi:YggT family protein
VNPQIANAFTAFLYILMALVIVRALMTWLNPSPDNQLWQLLNRIVEPLLEPIRRIMPRTGMIDLSAMVLIILLQLMVAVVQQTASS